MQRGVVQTPVRETVVNMQNQTPSGEGTRAPEFSVIREELDDCILIRVSGEVDMTTSGALLGALAPDRERPFVIDLSETTFMDSTGLNALVAARNRGARIGLRRPSRNVRQTLAVTGLDGAFTIKDD